MRLFLFWPILILLGIPNALIAYWEEGIPSYSDLAACESRLDPLEAEARADEGFRKFVQGYNGGQPPGLVFSRECIGKPPGDYLDDLRKGPGPGERT